MLTYRCYLKDTEDVARVVRITKEIFAAQLIDLPALYDEYWTEENGFVAYTWDDRKDFTDEDSREEFNKLMFGSRNSKVVNPRIKQLWETRK